MHWKIIRTVALLTMARLLVNITRRFHYLFIPQISRELAVPITDVQRVVAAQSITGLTSPLFGPFAERYGRKRAMIAGQVLIALGCVPGALAPAAFGVFYAVMLVFGIAKWTFDPALLAYLADRVAYARRGRAIGITELSWAGSLLVAGPLTGYLLGLSGLQLVYVTIGVSNGLAALVLFLFLPPDADRFVSKVRQPFGVGFREILCSRVALGALGFSFMFYTANEVMFVVYGQWMEATFNLELRALGVVTTVIAVAEVCGEGIIIGFSDRIGKYRLALLGTLVSSFGYFALPYLDFALWGVLVGLFVAFLGYETAVVASIPLFTEVLPQARATMMSTNIAAQATGRFVGAFAAGGIYLAGGFRLTTVVALGVGLTAFALMLVFIEEPA